MNFAKFLRTLSYRTPPVSASGFCKYAPGYNACFIVGRKVALTSFVLVFLENTGMSLNKWEHLIFPTTTKHVCFYSKLSEGISKAYILKNKLPWQQIILLIF